MSTFVTHPAGRLLSVTRPANVLSIMAQMAAVARQRRALGQLDADRLSDLGISRDEADQEASRPMWSV